MNSKKFFIAFVVAFIFIFVYEFVFHGMIMTKSYAEMSAMMRPQTEMKMPVLILGQAVIAFFFTLTFVRGFGSGGGVAGGFRYGVLIGLLFCGANLITYAVQPVTAAVLIAWCVGMIIEFAIAGAIVGALYKPGTSA
jgi:hypothetical protein